MPKGGERPGAERPKGTGSHGEATHPIGMPISMINDIKRFIAGKGYKIPFYSSKVQAGFPSPADSHMEGGIDLNVELVKNPAATFVVRATGDSMINVGIKENDLLIVDKSIDATNGKIIIAVLDGQFTVKRLLKEKDKIYLISENENYPPIEIYEGSSFMVWGVVTRIIHMPYS